MATIKFQFGAWFQDEAGDVRLFPIVLTDAQPAPEGLVIFRAAVLKHEAHLAAVEAGEARPDVLQLSMKPTAARLFASQLAAAADVIDGKVSLHG